MWVKYLITYSQAFLAYAHRPSYPRERAASQTNLLILINMTMSFFSSKSSLFVLVLHLKLSC